MKKTLQTVIVFWCFLGCMSNALSQARAQSTTTSENTPSLLILTNGEVLRGVIRHENDYYRVDLPHGHLMVRDGQVELWCRSMEEGYLHRRAGIRTGDVEEHLTLVRWCLRHKLTDAAAEQLQFARHSDPDHPTIDFLSRRLNMANAMHAASQTSSATDRPQTPAASIQPRSNPDPNVVACAATVEEPILQAGTHAITVTNLRPSFAELDRMVRSLPSGTVETFTRTVQPILVHSCATTHCHGSLAESDFQLTRIPIGRPAGRKYTQRNLYATLQQIDFEKPEESRLLTNARQAHGDSLLPPMTMRHLEQYRVLVDWTMRIAGSNCDRPTRITTSNPQLPTTVQSTTPAATDIGQQPVGLQPLPQIAPVASPSVIAESPVEAVAPPVPTILQLLPQDASDARLLEPAQAPRSSIAPSVTPAGYLQPSPPPTSVLSAASFDSLSNPAAASTQTPIISPAPEETDTRDESRILRGNPRAGLFEPKDPFDPEQFNRRYHGSPTGSITFGPAAQ